MPSKNKSSVRSNKKYTLNENTPWIISEAYKTARTNLIFSLATSERKIILFTSCNPAEGKSTTCVNMAITMSQMGEKVLIIDGDLRKPTIHNLLNLPKNGRGLSSIFGGFSNVGEALNENVMPNLDVITSGPIPPNPAELIASKNMQILLDKFSEYYDYIFIDSPPLNVVSDSQLMNNSISGIVFVVKENETTHADIQEAFRSVELAQGKILGIIKVNCGSKGKGSYKNNKSKKYKYDYKYSYGKDKNIESKEPELKFD